MVSMKIFIATTAAVTKAGSSVDHVHTTVSHIEDVHTDREMDMSSPVDEDFFTPIVQRGHYGSSRVELPPKPAEFVRKEIDCALLKGNQTLPVECSVFADQSSWVATNSTSTVDPCESLTGMDRIRCYGTTFPSVDCSKFKGSSTMPYECAKQLGMFDEESHPETTILEEARSGDELTWEKAFTALFPDLVASEEPVSFDDACFSCDYLSAFFPADSLLGRLANKASNLVKSVFDEPKLSADDVLDCSMQLGNKTMTAECSEALDSEFVYYRGENYTNSTITKEPKISPLGFIVEEVDCDKLRLQGHQTLPWQCMTQNNSTKFN